MHILLVCYYFRPDLLSGTRRLGMFVDALRARGIKVSVLAGGHYNEFDEVDVHRPRYIDWWWTLHDAAKKIGIIRFYKNKIKKNNLAPKVRKMGWRSFSEVLFPDKYLPWIRPATKLGLSLIRDNKIDVIVSSFPSPSSAVVARRLKQKSGVPWVCELRDFWSDSPHDVPQGSFASFNRWFERRTLSDADAFIAVTKGIGRSLLSRYKNPVHVIYSPIPENKTVPAPLTDDIFKIIYTGALYSGSRDISALICAIKTLELKGEVTPKTLQFIYYGFDDRSSIEAMFLRHNALPYLSFGGLIDRVRAVEEQRSASLLYLPLWSEPEFDGILSGKVFEYLGHRRPILATSFPGGELDNFLRETGCGMSIVDEKEIADSLSRWIKCYRAGDSSLGEFFPREEVLREYIVDRATDRLIQIFKDVGSRVQ